MSIRTDGDIIRAYNGARDLASLVRKVIRCERAVNGDKLGVTQDEYFLSITNVQPDHISVAIIMKSQFTSSATYNDPVYDMGSGPDDGADGVLYYTEKTQYTTHTSVNTIGIKIPIVGLLMEEEELMRSLTKTRDKRLAEESATKKAAEIKKMEEDLAKLKGN